MLRKCIFSLTVIILWNYLVIFCLQEENHDCNFPSLLEISGGWVKVLINNIRKLTKQLLSQGHLLFGNNFQLQLSVKSCPE